jgi:hypothetical protein
MKKNNSVGDWSGARTTGQRGVKLHEAMRRSRGTPASRVDNVAGAGMQCADKERRLAG